MANYVAFVRVFDYTCMHAQKVFVCAAELHLLRACDCQSCITFNYILQRCIFFLGQVLCIPSNIRTRHEHIADFDTDAVCCPPSFTGAPGRMLSLMNSPVHRPTNQQIDTTTIHQNRPDVICKHLIRISRANGTCVDVACQKLVRSSRANYQCGCRMPGIGQAVAC